MGWEWRIFCTNEDSLDVWKLLHQKPPLLGIAYKRTDLYVLCTNSVSIKFRDGEDLEFKIREERHESGAELWRKVQFHDVSLRKNSDIKILQSVVAGKLESLAHEYDKDLQRLLMQAAQQVRDNWRCVEVSKKRQNGYHAGVHVEQTNINLTGKNGRWQTICFEGSLENILKFVTDDCGKQVIETARGYPEFLCAIEE